jgi:PelA/Pel-15E family pectate lyase
MRHAVLLGVSLGAGIAAQARPQTDASAKLPGAAVERDTMSMVAPARLAALSPAVRAPWVTYAARSREQKLRDSMLVAGELRGPGRTQMTRAPYLRESFTVDSSMTPKWFHTDSARRMGETMLSFQTPSGGWSKHVDMSQAPRQPGQSFFSENENWQYIATLDNNSTTSEMEFLARLDAARPDVRYRDAFVRGVRYLLAAQYPNGCWPQVYPLQGGYHDAATFNDDAIVNATRLLRDVGSGRYAFVPAPERDRASAAVAHAIECMLAAQALVNGKRAIWPQQADPLTLQPVDARSYEHKSLAGRESVPVLSFLMSLPRPNAQVIDAIHGAADFFAATRIDEFTYVDHVLTKQAGAGPLWPRMYELGTNRPIFSNRDGIVLYDWSKLTDRRDGYVWYTDAPLLFRREYDRWARSHPREQP